MLIRLNPSHFILSLSLLLCVVVSLFANEPENIEIEEYRTRNRYEEKK